MISRTGMLELLGAGEFVEPTVSDTVVECERDPLDAVTFTA
jgi:hypothetical protein